MLRAGPLRAAIEVAAILLLSTIWFFWGTGRGEFVGTEALRAVVAKEMLERGDWLIPTVHHRPYLRKPPLYAWTSAAVGHAVGRFDEAVARWPSAAMGVLYVLALYFGGRWLIDSRAGPAAAALGGVNWLVLDYGCRAELDEGLLAMTTIAVLCGSAAWQSAGARRWLLYAVAYAAAAIGSLWKAPHVLIMLWLALGGLAWFDRRAGAANWRAKLLHPSHLVCAVIGVSIVGAYGILLSRAVGAGRVGKFAVWEIAARLIPHSPSDLLGILMALPELAGNTLPACVLAAVLIMPRWRPALDERQRATLRVLLAWFVPNLIFLTIAPAKAPRYWFGIFGAIALLAAAAWYFGNRNGWPARTARGLTLCWRIMLVVGVLCGVGLVVAGGLLLAGVFELRGVTGGAGPAAGVACGLLIALLAAWGLRWTEPRLLRFGPALVLALIALSKPIHALAIMPGRGAYESLRPAAERIDALVPPGRTVYVLSDEDNNDRSGELSDFGYYCRHPLRWPMSAVDMLKSATAADLADGEARTCYVLVREKAFKRLSRQFGDSAVTVIENLTPLGKEVSLVRVAIDAAAGS